MIPRAAAGSAAAARRRVETDLSFRAAHGRVESIYERAGRRARRPRGRRRGRGMSLREALGHRSRCGGTSRCCRARVVRGSRTLFSAAIARSRVPRRRWRWCRDDRSVLPARLPGARLASCDRTATIEFGTHLLASAAPGSTTAPTWDPMPPRTGRTSERDVLLAAGVHVPSGSADARHRDPSSADPGPARRPGLVRDRSGAWIGSGAVVMADVGPRLRGRRRRRRHPAGARLGHRRRRAGAGSSAHRDAMDAAAA